MLKINLGCGPVQPDGWVNVDNSLRAQFATRLKPLDNLLVSVGVFPPTEFKSSVSAVNLQKRLPWADNTVDAVYGGEVLEHFTKDDGMRLVRECFRVLRPGGILRLRVPDNARFWSNYVTEYRSMREGPREKWSLEHTRWIEMFFRDINTGFRLGSTGHYHKFMYDDISLILTFEQAGFRNVERMDFLKSRMPDVSEVEVREDLIVEGEKPR